MDIKEDIENHINNYFKEQNIDEISFDTDDLKIIFEGVIDHIFSNELNSEKRESMCNDVSKYFNEYFGERGVKRFLKSKYENKKSDLDNIQIEYKWCLSNFNKFIKHFIKDEKIYLDILEKILGILINLVKTDINNLISIVTNQNFRKYHYQVYHAINTTIYSIIAAKELNFSEEEMKNIGYCSLLHDLGMLKIEEALEEAEDEDERESILNTHIEIIYDILDKKELFNDAIKDGIYQHHELCNGNGYPNNLDGVDISKFARIIAISDTLDAQISSKDKPKTPYAALKEIFSNGEIRYDTDILKVFLKTISLYPPGSLVQLSDNSIGFVSKVNLKNLLKPLIKIIIDNEGNQTNEFFLDLSKKPEISIIKVLDKNEFI